MATEKTLEIQKKPPKPIIDIKAQLKKLRLLRAFRMSSGGLLVAPRDPIMKVSTHNHSQKSSKSRRLMAKASRKINRGK